MQPIIQQTVPANAQPNAQKIAQGGVPASTPVPIPAELLQQIGGGAGPTGTW